jgi:UDP-N-acetylglucosamine transferase subunit ALG13
LGRRQDATGIQAAMSGADLIISHAGAGSIIESLGLGARA